MLGKKEKNIEISEDFLDVQLSENQEKLDKLSENQKKILDDISEWLTKNRDYRDYDLDAEFKVEKIMPLLKFVEHEEIIFHENGISQKLRIPLELTNKNEDVVKTISKLEYKSRYKAFELDNYTKGINISKEMGAYMNAQVGMLVGYPKGVIGKLSDVDHSLTRIIQTLYFL